MASNRVQDRCQGSDAERIVPWDSNVMFTWNLRSQPDVRPFLTGDGVAELA